MREELVTFALGVLYFCAIKPAAWAGAWVQDAGRAELISTIAWHEAALAYDDEGQLNVPVEFDKFETSVFGEYGFRKNWSLVVRLSYQDVSLQRGASLDEKSGLGASYFSLKRKLFQKSKWIISAQAGAFLPGSVENGLDLRLGAGEIDAETRLLVGRSFKVFEQNGFLDIQMARRFRASEKADNWHVDATAGLHIRPELLLMAQSFMIQSDEINLPGQRTLRQTRLQGSLVWFYRPNTGVQMFLAQPVLGRNTLADRAFGLAVWSRF